MIDRMNPATTTSEDSIIYSLQSSFLYITLGTLFFQAEFVKLKNPGSHLSPDGSHFMVEGPEVRSFHGHIPLGGRRFVNQFVMELFEIGFKWKVCSNIVNVVHVKVVYVWYVCDYAVLNVEDRPRLHTLVISPCSLFHLQTLTLNPILCICLAICRLCIYKHINM